MKKKMTFILAVLLICTTLFGSDDIKGAKLDTITVGLMGIVDPDGGDRISWMNTASKGIYELHGSSIIEYKGYTKQDLIRALDSQNILVVRTHANATTLRACADGKNIERLYRDEILHVFREDELSNLKICMLSGCCTAEGGRSGKNVMNAIYSRGAECVIGFSKSINRTQANYMAMMFCCNIGEGYYVDDAVTNALDCVFAKYGTYGAVDSVVIQGSAGVRFADFVEEDDMLKEDYFAQFDLKSYQYEEICSERQTNCCYRMYINGIKTNDVVYYITDSNGQFLSNGAPRVGNGKTAYTSCSEISENLVRDYVLENYGDNYEITDIVIDVNDVKNPVVLVETLNEDNYDFLTIAIREIIN